MAPLFESGPTLPGSLFSLSAFFKESIYVCR